MRTVIFNQEIKRLFFVFCFFMLTVLSLVGIEACVSFRSYENERNTVSEEAVFQKIEDVQAILKLDASRLQKQKDFQNHYLKFFKNSAFHLLDYKEGEPAFSYYIIQLPEKRVLTLYGEPIVNKELEAFLKIWGNQESGACVLGETIFFLETTLKDQQTFKLIAFQIVSDFVHKIETLNHTSISLGSDNDPRFSVQSKSTNSFLTFLVQERGIYVLSLFLSLLAGFLFFSMGYRFLLVRLEKVYQAKIHRIEEEKNQTQTDLKDVQEREQKLSQFQKSLKSAQRARQNIHERVFSEHSKVLEAVEDIQRIILATDKSLNVQETVSALVKSMAESASENTVLIDIKDSLKEIILCFDEQIALNEIEITIEGLDTYLEEKETLFYSIFYTFLKERIYALPSQGYLRIKVGREKEKDFIRIQDNGYFFSSEEFKNTEHQKSLDKNHLGFFRSLEDLPKYKDSLGWSLEGSSSKNNLNETTFWFHKATKSDKKKDNIHYLPLDKK